MLSTHLTGPCIGIDFGTTNSSIALARENDTVELISFPTAAATTESFRSVLYLEQRKHGGRTQIKGFTGPAGIEQYLQAEHKGRLIQSLATSNIAASKVDQVFLTGGTSFVPAVRRIFESRFTASRVRTGNEFTSVARGLALKARQGHTREF